MNASFFVGLIACMFFARATPENKAVAVGWGFCLLQFFLVVSEWVMR